MRILFLSRWCPVPANNGSKIRVLNLVRSLCRHHQVTLVSFYDMAETIDEQGLRETGLEDVKMVPYCGYRPLSGRSILGLFAPTPRSVVGTRSSEMEDVLRREIGAAPYDLVVASQVWMASYEECFAGVPAIFEEVELALFRDGYRSLPRQLRPLPAGLSWQKHRRFIDRLVRRFAACTVVSEKEKRLLEEAAPHYKAVSVIPNGIDLKGLSKAVLPREANSLVFAGSLRYRPNYEAMHWFVSGAYSLIKSAVPNARLAITGEASDQALPAAAGVTLTGLVQDVRSLVASASVSICPLQSGGGTRLKILEAMALRTPIVSTSKAVEGLDVVHGRHVLIADGPCEFADAVICLLKRPELGQALAAEAFNLLQQVYDWSIIEPMWLGLVEHTVKTQSQSSRSRVATP